jgi:hypothetical protein
MTAFIRTTPPSYAHRIVSACNLTDGTGVVKSHHPFSRGAILGGVRQLSE